ncbi:hypothetical protein NPIL_689591 [Nephila pilipes]|uniref:Uncharacterized protein n=1 Tax=Nephila pilipes TaxID=299642 RepID=A0A8X6QDT9_NEPPI|nr:hypothetical protein NPIL_689591 [Nephila pilipes]
MIYASGSKDRRLLYDLECLRYGGNRKTSLMIVASVLAWYIIGYIRKNKKKLISYPDNIPSAIQTTPHGLNVVVPLPPIEFIAIHRFTSALLSG